MPTVKMEEVVRRFGCPLIELWGMTELAGLGTTFPSNGPIKLGSIGVALPHVEARIADVDDASKTMPRGDVGELMIKGPIVMQGYYGNEEATREAIEPDGWLHSGDIARMDEDGAIFVVDRKKDMINTAGFKVFPAEVERVVAEHPSVAMVAVGSQPDEMKGEIGQGLRRADARRGARLRGHHRPLPRATRRLQGAALRAVRGRPAEDIDREGHATRAEDPRRRSRGVDLVRPGGASGRRRLRRPGACRAA